MRRTALISLSLGILAMGCAPADVAGNYMVSTTNGDNVCGIDGWDAGGVGTGIPVVITQDGDVVQLTVEGLWGGALNLLVGSNRFNGTVGGSHIQADIVGSVTARQGQCVYTVTLELDADLNGDVLTGEVAYRPVTNRHADCGVLETCANIQRFNGTRPPSE